MPWLEDKEIAYDACINAGFEGVVFKQLTSDYKLQRKPEDQIVEWVKFKPASAEGW
jgi:ATP-dependent DNA ligase